MTEQLTIDGGTATPAPRLGARQTFVVDLLRRRGPMHADEVGAEIHHDLEKHGLDSRCDWCTPDARTILASLKKHRLVINTGGRWRPTGSREAASSGGGYDPDTAEIPF